MPAITTANEIILYQPDGAVSLEVRLESETVWLTQAQIAALFGVKVPAVSKHLRNIFKAKELIENSVISILETTAADGKNYQTKFYNLDAILSVGYRVNSINATLFRQWANRVLKEYLLKGYAVPTRAATVEQRLITNEHRLTAAEHRLETTEQRLANAENKIDFFVKTALPPVEGIFYDGQIFDAYVFAADLIKSAKKSLILIDNYIDESVLLLFAKRGAEVSAAIYTAKISAPLQKDLDKHREQYPQTPIAVHLFQKSHDRFLLIDHTVYHLGAPLKDLGKRWFAFSKMHCHADELLKRLE